MQSTLPHPVRQAGVAFGLKLWIYCAGVDAGSRLRVRGEGNVGRKGGEPGDLYVFISVKPHPAGLRREGTTIHSEVEISFVDAILGTTAKVSTADRLCLVPAAGYVLQQMYLLHIQYG